MANLNSGIGPFPRKWRLILLCIVFCSGILFTSAYSEDLPELTEMIETVRPDTALIRQYAQQLMEQNRMDDYASGGFTWDTERRTTSWRYFNGFMIDAMLKLGVGESVPYAEAFYEDNIQPDGSIVNYMYGYLDSIEPARPLFRLPEDSAQADLYRKAIQWIYSRLEEQTSYPMCGNNLLHHQQEDGTPAANSEIYPLFLDGMYMTQPFLAACAASIREGRLSLTDRNGEPVSAETLEKEIVDRYVWLAENLYSVKDGLYQHGWNVSASTGNGYYWGRGIGWLAMSMADVIELLPEGSGRDSMIGMLLQLIDGMLQYQDGETGMWYNVISRGSELHENRLETSVTGMMAYTLVKAWNDGYAGDQQYLLRGLQAFHGVIKMKTVIQDNLIHIQDTYLKSGVGDSDDYYCRQGYTTDEAKGTAAVLMAAAEIEKAIQTFINE